MVTGITEPTEPSALAQSVEELAEVGPARAKQLRKLGVNTLGDLLQYFPRGYQFESEERPIARLMAGEIGTARGEVTAVNDFSKRGRARFEATLSDGPYRLALVFFHSGYIKRELHPGMVLRVRGMVKSFRGLPQMVNPKWEIVKQEMTPAVESKLRAIYPAGGRMSSETIERIISANLEAAVSGIGEWFEPAILARRKLLGRAAAYRAIHQPVSRTQALAARRRLVYDELMAMQLGLVLSRRLGGGRISAPVMRIDKTLDQRIQKRFPFELTGAQKNAIWQIVADLKSGRPMKRLLQGDVGSGKTVVALYAMLVAVANKMQAALLAPTEVLAEQHYLTLTNLLKESGVKIDLFTSRTRRLAKGKLDRRLADGEVHLAIGTQALLQEKIEFANLGLIVVDEQHRLGVRQRATLSGKGTAPHYLVMTATPIPRTLALSYFADFELTTIDAMPPGRQAIETRWLNQSQSDQAYAFVRRQVETGRQAYIVVPQVNDDGGFELGDNGKSVTQHLKRLSTGPLKSLRLAPLHGQMPSEEKERTMSMFRRGEIDVLVATTVIEVGIDVPNSTVIVIDGAERFGLSQLHQLRGRVGRGIHASYCILLADAAGDAEARLAALTKTTSGFEIAEMDLELRGPGEFFGLRQHGLPEFKLADIRNERELLLAARDDAGRLLERDPHLNAPAHADLRRAMNAQFGKTLGLAQVG